MTLRIPATTPTTTPPVLPEHASLVTELRQLRGAGVVRLRHAPFDALHRAAAACRPADRGDDPVRDPAAVEAMLRRAVQRLDGTLGSAAAYGLGLVAGTRDWPSADRRSRAAQEYGVSVERFRKHHEPLIWEQLAQQIVEMARQEAARAAGAAPRVPTPRTTLLDLPVPPSALGTPGRRVPVAVHLGPLETVQGSDVLVSTENVFLEMSKSFGSSVSAALRRAAAIRDGTGQIVDDVLPRALAEWSAKHGRNGLPVAPGTVVPTEAGRLTDQGVRRIYHACVTAPDHEGGYVTDPAAITRAVGEVFRTLRAEGDSFDPPLRSVCLPLLGAGRGGLGPQASLEWVWRAVAQELAVRPVWRVALSVRQEEDAELVVARLTAAGATVR
jgi:O-acetyl-ADP-ribose deacetylase (regulator of RNase III)